MISLDLYPLFFTPEKLGCKFISNSQNNLALATNIKINSVIAKRFFGQDISSSMLEGYDIPFAKDGKIIYSNNTMDISDSNMYYDISYTYVEKLKRLYEEMDVLTYFDTNTFFVYGLSSVIEKVLIFIHNNSDCYEDMYDKLLDADFVDPSCNFIIQYFMGFNDGFKLFVKDFNYDKRKIKKLLKIMNEGKESLELDIENKGISLEEYLYFFDYDAICFALNSDWNMTDEHILVTYSNQAVNDWFDYCKTHKIDKGELEKRASFLFEFLINSSFLITKQYLVDMGEMEEEIPYEKETIYFQLWLKEVDEVIELLNQKYRFTECEKKHFEKYLKRKGAV